MQRRLTALAPPRPRPAPAGAPLRDAREDLLTEGILALRARYGAGWWARLTPSIVAELARRAAGWVRRGRLDAARADEFGEMFVAWLACDGRRHLVDWDPDRNDCFWGYLAGAHVLDTALRLYRKELGAGFGSGPEGTDVPERRLFGAAPGSARWLELAHAGDLVLATAEAEGEAVLATLVLAHYGWFAEYAARLVDEGVTDLRARRIDFAVRCAEHQTARSWAALARILEDALAARIEQARTTVPAELVAMLLRVNRPAINTRICRLRAALARSLERDAAPAVAVTSDAHRLARALLSELLRRQANGHAVVVSYTWVHEHLFARTPVAWEPRHFEAVIGVARGMRAERVPGLGDVRLDAFIVRADTGRPGRGHWEKAMYSPPAWARLLGRARRITNVREVV